MQAENSVQRLDYGHDARSRPRVPKLLIVVGVLALIAASTAVRIEILNVRAGHPLRKTEPGKWRAIGGIVAIRAWRESEAYGRNDPTLVSRALSPAEQRELDAYLRRAEANADLRDLVGSWGLVQYPLVLVGLFLAQVLAWHGRLKAERRAGAGLSLVFVVCIVLVCARDYWGSLGW